MNEHPDIRNVARHFQISGEFLDAEPCGRGHINDTYCAVFGQGGRRVRYILQRINHHVFEDPAALMENIQRVTAHIRGKLAHGTGADRRVLTLIPTRAGGACHRNDGGDFWRAYCFIEGAHTWETVETPQQAFEAARAFGHFL